MLAVAAAILYLADIHHWTGFGKYVSLTKSGRLEHGVLFFYERGNL